MQVHLVLAERREVIIHSVVGHRHLQTILSVAAAIVQRALLVEEQVELDLVDSAEQRAEADSVVGRLVVDLEVDSVEPVLLAAALLTATLSEGLGGR